MFRRTRSATAVPPSGSGASAYKPGATPASTSATTTAGKGRPTPTRREAEAAAKARARGVQDKKQAAKLARQRRAEQSARVRQGMKTGDERSFPARDQGKVRRFVRDRIDSRLSMAEFLLPFLILIMVMQYSPSATLKALGTGLWSATILLVVLDTLFLIWRLKRDMRTRFAGETTKGAVTYGVLRSLQMRFLRLPKSQVKIGQKLPERY